jgi:hypothetical protein
MSNFGEGQTLIWTKQGQQDYGSAEAHQKILENTADMEWFDVPTKNVPFYHASAIKTISKNVGGKTLAISYNCGLGPMPLYGIKKGFTRNGKPGESYSLWLDDGICTFCLCYYEVILETCPT